MSHHLTLTRLFLLALPLALGGCGVFDWATNNMPVIGQRCENWQCFTSGGQQQSQLNEQMRLHPDQAATPGGAASGRAIPAQNPQAVQAAAPAPGAAATTAPGGTPAAAMAAPPTAAPNAPPAEPLAPPMPPSGAYVYVPRAKAEPGSTPFDGAMPEPVPSQ